MQRTRIATRCWAAISANGNCSRATTSRKNASCGRPPGRRKSAGRLKRAKTGAVQFTRFMKRRFRWWLSALLLYLLSVPIVFISIGLTAYMVMAIFIIVSGLTGASAAGYSWLVIFFMFFVGTPFSLLSSLFVPPMVLGWLRKRRLRGLRSVRRCSR